MAEQVDNLAVPKGKRLTVEFAVNAEGKMLAKEFLDDLNKTDPNTVTRILANFSHVANNGEESATDRMYSNERDEICAFKCKSNGRHVRLPCFREGSRMFITHGFIKPPQPKWPEQEFTLANEIRQSVLASLPEEPKPSTTHPKRKRRHGN